MQLAIESDPTVQHYIETLLQETAGQDAADELHETGGLHAAQLRETRELREAQELCEGRELRELPRRDGELESSGQRAGDIPRRQTRQAVRLAAAIAAAGQPAHGTLAATLTPASLPLLPASPAHESPPLDKDSDLRAASAAAAPRAAPLDRSEAFVRHLQIAQASTAQRLAGRVSRPAALAQAPEWVESEELACLTFKIANLKLALPLQYLQGVQSFPEADALAPCRLAAQSSWQDSFLDCCLGEIDQRVVIDTARLVMPERYAAAMAENYRQVLQIRDMDWCFAVDSIGGELAFHASEVRWRSQHTRREWLAGTVIDKMCAIVDVDALHRLLLAASVLGNASEQLEP